MALSGSFYTNVNSHWRLQIEWSGKQNVNDNYTDITVKMYWIARDGYGAVYSSATKTSAIQVDNGSWHTESGQLAKLSGNQKKLINTYSFRKNHNADGTASFSVDGYFDAKVTLSGTYYGRIDLDQKSFTLNTIPRASTLSSSANWTAGNNLAINASRASSKFTHIANIYAKDSGGSWVMIKGVENIGTSATANFSTAEMKTIFNALNGRSSTESRIYLDTYNGSTKIGYNTYYGTIKAPTRSTTTFGGGDFNIGSTMKGSVNRRNSILEHTIQLVFGGKTFTILSRSKTIDWSFDTSTIASTLYGMIPNAKSISGKIQIYTYYEGIRVAGIGESNLTAHVVNSEPKFSASQFTFKDINATTVGITGNDQYIVQNQSELQAFVNTAATPQNGASISNYIVTINGKEGKINGTTGNVKMGKVEAGANQSLSVKAVDSRGFSTTVSKTVTVLPYTAPEIVVKLERENKFDRTTRIDVNGTIAALKVGTVNKNAVKSLDYKYREVGASDWNTTASITFTTSGNSFTGQKFALDLDNTKKWEFEFSISDKFATTTDSEELDKGQPIFFIDAQLRSIGFNDFPVQQNEIRVNGRIVFGSNMWASNSSGEGFGAMDLNNSDVTGINGLYFNDIYNNSGEGLMFLKSGKTSGTSNVADYDQFGIRDGQIHFNGDWFLERTSGGFNIDLKGGVITAGSFAMDGDSDMRNHDIRNVNHLTFNDPGSNEGIEWLNGNGWKIVEAPFNMTNAPGDIQFARNNNPQATITTSGSFWIEGNFVGRGDRNTYYTSEGNSIFKEDKSGKEGIKIYGDDGRIASMNIYDRTYSGAANMYITGYGTIGRATSASKYKLDIQEVETDGFAERILQLNPKSWFDKSATEDAAKYLDMKMQGLIEAENMEPKYLERHYGLIAEDLVAAGLQEYVQYGAADEEGNREVEGIEYDRVWTLLIPLVKEHRERITQLETEIKTLKGE